MREPRDFAGIGEAVEALDRAAQLAGAGGAEDRLGQRVEFGGEAFALRRDVGARDAGVVARPQYAAVGQRDLDFGGGLRPVVLEIERDLVAQRDRSGSLAVAGL